MTDTAKSRTHQLIDALLEDTTLADLARELRAAGWSWAKIALEVRDRTHLDVTGESIRNWLADQDGMTRTTKVGAA